MKKTICVLILIITCILLSSCGGADNDLSEKLYKALTENNLEALREVLNSENVNKVDFENLPESEFTQFSENDSRALGIALSHSDDYVVGELIKSGYVEVTTEDDYTYLREIACNRSAELMEVILDAGADVNAGEEPALESLLRFMYPKIKNADKRVQLLIDYGAAINQDSLDALMDNEWRYLYVPKLMNWMAENKFQIEMPEDLKAAASGENQKLQRLIKDKKINNAEDVVLFASATCSAETIEMMIENGYDFSIKDAYGIRPIHAASLCNSLDAVKVMLNRTENVDAVSEDGLNAVTYAAIGGNKEVFNLLTNSGIPIQNRENYITSCGRVPASTWDAACCYGTEKSIACILDSGYMVSELDCYNAYIDCTESVFDALIANDIPCIYSFEGNSVLDGCNKKYAQILMKKGAKPSEETLYYAVESRNYDFIEELLKYGCDINNKYWSAAENAVLIGDMKSLKMFSNYGLDPNCRVITEDSSMQLIDIAASSPSENISEYLAELE